MIKKINHQKIINKLIKRKLLTEFPFSKLLPLAQVQFLSQNQIQDRRTIAIQNRKDDSPFTVI